MILYRVFPLIYLINVFFFLLPISSELHLARRRNGAIFFQIEIVSCSSIKKTVTPKPYGSHSKTLKICYPPPPSHNCEVTSTRTFIEELSLSLSPREVWSKSSNFRSLDIWEVQNFYIKSYKL